MMKMVIEKNNETNYQYSFMTVLCKNMPYTDAVVGRKVFPKVGKDE